MGSHHGYYLKNYNKSSLHIVSQQREEHFKILIGPEKNLPFDSLKEQLFFKKVCNLNSNFCNVMESLN